MLYFTLSFSFLGYARDDESDGTSVATGPFYGPESNALRILAHKCCPSSQRGLSKWPAQYAGPIKCHRGANVSTGWSIQPSSRWTDANDAWV
jgi:hypothetical protein